MRKNRKRSSILLAFCAALCVCTNDVLASALGAAKAAQAALARGDNAAAVRLFTQALVSGGLSRNDRELAYVRRAKAYAAEQNRDAALADLAKALKLDPHDQEAIDLRSQLTARDGAASQGPAMNPWPTFQALSISRHVPSVMLPGGGTSGATETTTFTIIGTSNGVFVFVKALGVISDSGQLVYQGAGRTEVPLNQVRIEESEGVISGNTYRKISFTCHNQAPCVTYTDISSGKIGNPVQTDLFLLPDKADQLYDALKPYVTGESL